MYLSLSSPEFNSLLTDNVTQKLATLWVTSNLLRNVVVVVVHNFLLTLTIDWRAQEGVRGNLLKWVLSVSTSFPEGSLLPATLGQGWENSWHFTMSGFPTKWYQNAEIPPIWHVTIWLNGRGKLASGNKMHSPDLRSDTPAVEISAVISWMLFHKETTSNVGCFLRWVFKLYVWDTSKDLSV